MVDASASQLSPLTTNSIQNGCSEDTRCQQRQPKLGYWKKAVKGPMLVPNLPVLTSFTNAALEFFVSASWQSSGLNSCKELHGQETVGGGCACCLFQKQERTSNKTPLLTPPPDIPFPPSPFPKNEKPKHYVVEAVIKAISSSGFRTPSAVGSKACLSAKTKHKETS